MEIKITISDTGVQSSVTAGQQVGSSLEAVGGAAAIGAIDAGRAPAAAGSTGAPQPFISAGTSGDVTTSPGVWAGSSAAVPNSGSVVESVTNPGENG